jgi:hypothetical protein
MELRVEDIVVDDPGRGGQGEKYEEGQDLNVEFRGYDLD